MRNVDKKEVDFLIAVDGKPWFAVEVKASDEILWQPLLFFKNKLNIPFAFQVVEKPNVNRVRSGIRIVSADRFLAGLI